MTTSISTEDRSTFDAVPMMEAESYERNIIIQVIHNLISEVLKERKDHLGELLAEESTHEQRFLIDDDIDNDNDLDIEDDKSSARKREDDIDSSITNTRCSPASTISTHLSTKPEDKVGTSELVWKVPDDDFSGFKEYGSFSKPIDSTIAEHSARQTAELPSDLVVNVVQDFDEFNHQQTYRSVKEEEELPHDDPSHLQANVIVELQDSRSNEAYEVIWNRRKLVVEKEAEQRAQRRLTEYNREGKSMEDVIDITLKEYGEFHEMAHTVRLKFEEEKMKLLSVVQRLVGTKTLDNPIHWCHTSEGSDFQYFLSDSDDGEEPNTHTTHWRKKRRIDAEDPPSNTPLFAPIAMKGRPFTLPTKL